MSFQTQTNSLTMKVDLFNGAVTSNTSILSSQISGSIQPWGIMLIYITAANAGSLSIKRTGIDGVTTVTETYAAEVANQPNWHNFQASWGEKFNFTYSVSTTFLKFGVAEVVPLTISMSG